MQYSSPFYFPVEPPTAIDQIDLCTNVLSLEVAASDEFRLRQGLIRLRKAVVLGKDISKDWQKWHKAADAISRPCPVSAGKITNS